MSEVTAKSFLNLLNQSGIVPQEELRPVLAELKTKAAGKSVGLGQLTKHLIDAGLITEWHSQKLCNGRYRGFFLGKYKLLRHLGTGGMSTVYLAQHTMFKQQRAIKVLPKKRVDDKTYLDRFYREGRAAASLNHKNIVRVYDIDHDGTTHYLVMEFVEGRDIYEMVKEIGPIKYRTAIDFVTQALSGLQHAHENNLVHRDIKPANLLVTPDGVVKILDLGLALFREDETSLTVMHNERVLGTADYLSPEQAVDSHNLDHRADIYSLGCTLYYMLLAKPPFSDGTIAQRIAMHQSATPTSISEQRPDCPFRLEQICFKMMEKNPDDRFQSCAELKTIFHSLVEELTPSAVTVKTTGPTQGSKRPVADRAVKAAGQARAQTTRQTTGPAKSTERAEAAARGKTSAKPVVQATKISKEISKGQAAPGKVGAHSEKPGSRPATTRPSPNPQSGQAPSAPSSPPAQRQKRHAGPASKQTANKALTLRRKNAGNVSVLTGSESNATSVVDPAGLRAFSLRNAPKSKSIVRRRSSVNKRQLIVAGIVIVMVLSLTAILAIAMRLTKPSDTKKAGFQIRHDSQVVLQKNTLQIRNVDVSVLHEYGCSGICQNSELSVSCCIGRPDSVKIHSATAIFDRRNKFC